MKTDWLKLIEAERHRQIDVEGFGGDHDAGHGEGQLAMAAACYAAPCPILVHAGTQQRWEHDPRLAPKTFGVDAWPWEVKWDKRGKHSRQRQLVIAAALIVAELERMEETTDDA